MIKLQSFQLRTTLSISWTSNQHLVSTKKALFFFLFIYFFLNNIYFNWRLITLQYCSGFCHTLTWISHRCTCGPHLEPPSYLPPHPIPQGCPSAPALSALFHASNLGWWSSSHMVIYMFQCYFLKPSHPLLLPESKSLFFLSVSFAVSHIGSLLPSFWIPYICINILYWCFSFWLTLLQFHPPH